MNSNPFNPDSESDSESGYSVVQSTTHKIKVAKKDENVHVDVRSPDGKKQKLQVQVVVVHMQMMKQAAVMPLLLKRGKLCQMLMKSE